MKFENGITGCLAVKTMGKVSNYFKKPTNLFSLFGDLYPEKFDNKTISSDGKFVAKINLKQNNILICRAFGRPIVKFNPDIQKYEITAIEFMPNNNSILCVFLTNMLCTMEGVYKLEGKLLFYHIIKKAVINVIDNLNSVVATARFPLKKDINCFNKIIFPFEEDQILAFGGVVKVTDKVKIFEIVLYNFSTKNILKTLRKDYKYDDFDDYKIAKDKVIIFLDGYIELIDIKKCTVEANFFYGYKLLYHNSHQLKQTKNNTDNIIPQELVSNLINRPVAHELGDIIIKDMKCRVAKLSIEQRNSVVNKSIEINNLIKFSVERLCKPGVNGEFVNKISNFLSSKYFGKIEHSLKQLHLKSKSSINCSIPDQIKFAFSKDGKNILSFFEGKFELWDIALNKIISTHQESELEGECGIMFFDEVVGSNLDIEHNFPILLGCNNDNSQVQIKMLYPAGDNMEVIGAEELLPIVNSYIVSCEKWL